MNSVEFNCSENPSIFDKCNRANVLLKENYKLLIQQSYGFLNLIDVDKLVFTKAAKLTPLLDTNIFSDLEKNWIKENRRRAINRKTAAESRERRKRDYRKLTSDLTSLVEHKESLTQQKIRFKKEIDFYKNKLYEFADGYSLATPFHPIIGSSY